jgi:hypothetical protein
VPVVRGSSARPLFVTAAGMPAAGAADLVRRMAGRYRLPDALRRADGQVLFRHVDLERRMVRSVVVVMLSS